MRHGRNWLKILLPIAAIAVAVIVTQVGAAQSAGPLHRITIRTAPNPATAGDTITVSGRVTGAGIENRQVVIWFEAGGQSRFTPIGEAFTNGDGSYKAGARGRAATVNGVWYAVAGGLQSAQVSERVHALITLANSLASPAPRSAGHVRRQCLAVARR